jgi:6-pyruvoyltetrahydropterin/6-carboxytetrahydropterin synthase
MYKAGVASEFEAKHYLRGDFGPESEPHSHPYEVEAVCETDRLGPQGFSVNIALLEEVLWKELEKIDKRLLNELPYFAERQTSLENLASYLWEQIRVGLQQGLAEGEELPREMELRIWESPTAWAAYRAPLREQ